MVELFWEICFIIFLQIHWQLFLLFKWFFSCRLGWIVIDIYVHVKILCFELIINYKFVYFGLKIILKFLFQHTYQFLLFMIILDWLIWDFSQSLCLSRVWLKIVWRIVQILMGNSFIFLFTWSMKWILWKFFNIFQIAYYLFINPTFFLVRYYIIQIHNYFFLYTFLF